MQTSAFCRKPKLRKSSGRASPAAIFRAAPLVVVTVLAATRPAGVMARGGGCSVPRAMHRGFTLLEVLVVLALIGLLSALALPQFSVIRDRLEFSLTRENFEHELRGLPYRALSEGRPFVLSGKYPRAPAAPRSPFEMPDNALAAVLDNPVEPGQYRAQLPINADDSPLTLPAAWTLTAEKPVIYQVSGFCSGGRVTVLVGSQRYVYELKAPECQVVLAK